MGQFEGGIEAFAAQIASLQRAYRFIFKVQRGIDHMCAVFTEQIDELCPEVADGTALIGHLVDVHVAGYRDIVVGIHQQVVVAFHHACYLWQEGHAAGQLVQVKAVGTDGDVL